MACLTIMHICLSAGMKYMSVFAPCSRFLLDASFSLLTDFSQFPKLFTNRRWPASRSHHNQWENLERCLYARYRIFNSVKAKIKSIHPNIKASRKCEHFNHTGFHLRTLKFWKLSYSCFILVLLLSSYNQVK